MEPDLSLLDAITDALGESPVGVTPLAGATSSQLFRFRIGDRDMVVRRFLAERWETATAELSLREHTILAALSAADLPAPAPVALLAENGVVMSLLPGRVELPQAPTHQWLDAVADMLGRIHRCTLRVPFTYESWNDHRSGPAPEWWRGSDLWTAAQRRAAEPPDFEPVFIHRDYHPVNLLWQGDRISGVVDWINACMGPAGVDVAHCRLNLALMYGLDAADQFLEAYESHMPGYKHDPYWEVDDALGVLPDVVPYPPWAEFGLTGLTAENVRRRLEAFVQAAVS